MSVASCAKCAYKAVCDSLPDDLTCEEVINVYAVGDGFEDEVREGFAADLDMGFDPYLGCYTDDV